MATVRSSYAPYLYCFGQEASVREAEIAAEDRKHKRKIYAIIAIVVAIIAFYVYLNLTDNEMLFILLLMWGLLIGLVAVMAKLAIKKTKSDQQIALEMKRMEMEMRMEEQKD
jgi:hypothetical protein